MEYRLNPITESRLTCGLGSVLDIYLMHLSFRRMPGVEGARNGRGGGGIGTQYFWLDVNLSGHTGAVLKRRLPFFAFSFFFIPPRPLFVKVVLGYVSKLLVRAYSIDIL